MTGRPYVYAVHISVSYQRLKFSLSSTLTCSFRIRYFASVEKSQGCDITQNFYFAEYLLKIRSCWFLTLLNIFLFQA